MICTYLTCGKLAGPGPVCECCGKPLRLEDLSAEQLPNSEGSGRRDGRLSRQVIKCGVRRGFMSVLPRDGCASNPSIDVGSHRKLPWTASMR